MFGDAILNMLGNEDPRRKIMDQLLGSTAGAPAQPPAGGATPAAAGTGAGTTAPASPAAQPTAPAQEPRSDVYNSPPDLSALYSDLMKREEKSRRIDTGIGLIAAGLAHPENRAGIMQMMSGGGGGGSSGGDMLESIMGMRTQQAELASKAQQRAMVPGIAQRMGIDPQTAMMLFEQGKLADVISGQLDPENTQVVTRADGSIALVSKQDGRVIQEIGGKEAVNLETETVTRADGSIALINTQTGAVLQEIGAAEVNDPNNEVVTRADGSIALLNKNDGSIVSEIGAPKVKDRRTQVVQNANGRDVLMDLDTGDVIAEINPEDAKRDFTTVSMADGRTALIDKATAETIRIVGEPRVNTTADTINLDRVNREREAAGQPPISMEEWKTTQNKQTRPETNFNIDNNEIGKEFASTYVDDFASAQSSVNTISSIGQAWNQINSDAGIISGDLTAPVRLEGRKLLASVFGIDDAAAENTEAFQSSMRQVVLPLVKELGTGNSISNADREFIEKSVGANIQLTQGAVRKILAILEKGSRNKIIRYNREIDKLNAESVAAGEGKTGARLVQVPEPSSSFIASIPAGAIEELRKDQDPNARADFDSVFGLGMADYFLGASSGQ